MADRSSHGFFKRPPLVPTLLVAASAGVSLVVWTIPNLGEFSRNVAQLPALWQVSSNQPEIKRLLASVFAPIIIALIVGACCWLWYTIKPFVWPEREEANRQSMTHPVTADVSSRPAPPPQVHYQSVPSVTPTLPVTPLPPVLEESAQEQQAGSDPRAKPSSRGTAERLRRSVPRSYMLNLDESLGVRGRRQQSLREVPPPHLRGCHRAASVYHHQLAQGGLALPAHTR